MDCIFCKIIKGEIPSYKIYEDEYTYVFLDIAKDIDGHTLVIPKKHIKSLLDLEESDYILIGKIQKVINIIAKQLNIEEEGYRVIVNCGKDAGQEVMHLHYHLLAGRKLGSKIVG